MNIFKNILYLLLIVNQWADMKKSETFAVLTGDIIKSSKLMGEQRQKTLTAIEQLAGETSQQNVAGALHRAGWAPLHNLLVVYFKLFR